MYSSARLFSPAADRNASYIVETVNEYYQRYLSTSPPLNRNLTLLEVASGSGQHASALAKHCPHLLIQPSDRVDEHLRSINSYRFELDEKHIVHSLLKAESLDVTQDLNTWPLINQNSYDLMLCINMIHISPWVCTQALFRGAATHLSLGGYLITYGPYAFSSHPLAESNQIFHQSLKSRNPQWGIRTVDSLDQCAQDVGLKRIHTQACPANNHILVFQKGESH